MASYCIIKGIVESSGTGAGVFVAIFMTGTVGVRLALLGVRLQLKLQYCQFQIYLKNLGSFSILSLTRHHLDAIL